MSANHVMNTAMYALARVLLLVGACIAVRPALAQQPSSVSASTPTFASVALHDVVDSKGELDDDAVTTDRLVSFFDWLVGNGWTAVSLDDIARAGRGEDALPAKAVLITFDDGYRSLYTRVYPLALAYGFPIIAALVGNWMEPPAGSMVKYGSRMVPRERFITWDQAREMQRSRLVEFALHSQALHAEVVGNPQGNTMPSAVTRSYVPGVGYQSEADFAAALRADLASGRAMLQRELGRAPRALAWPYGRYNALGTQSARDLGFEFALVLDRGPAFLNEPLRLVRYLPTYNPPLLELAQSLRPDPNERRVDRLVCLDPAALWAGDEVASNERLGRAIERVRALGVTGLVVDAVRHDAQGRITAAWFPTRELPLAGDWLSRVAWQMHTRADVKVYARLPHRRALAALGDEARVQRLYEDLGALVPLDGWLLEDAGPLAQPVRFDDPPPLFEHRPGIPLSWSAWVVRERRRSMLKALGRTDGPDALGWRAFAALDAARPGLELLWLAPTRAVAAPHPLAEISLVPTGFGDPVADNRLARVDPTLLSWFTGSAPPDARLLTRKAVDFQRHGGVSLGWCPDDPVADIPAAAVAAPGVSASIFPLRR
ncbi:poly-beta-1,6-N-acetyl-D-glucosamine N-deacetylase PgaB [Variovorax sp. J22P240]|uniref:poly-beta-1,6-N-acetyl-D-glucosamine N-deacetylase PgaB n=1 Tax=Variovorax sp. J22P240 TaxID=3053514 RepID=UPI0025767758|nr:poly-beta-1,6-N-acetyl-D-glucosamine N-deacetylase PgaB [Variovorax sp. J22P240]MDL9997507.1 poly-beta-1,6-N-acetyl-D-glucosamine N-deacetylase PgaB [Variovorax sp. J22P240]